MAKEGWLELESDPGQCSLWRRGLDIFDLGQQHEANSPLVLGLFLLQASSRSSRKP